MLTAEDLQIQIEAVRQFIDEMVGLSKKVAGIDEDHRNVRSLPGSQVEHDG